MMRCPHCGEEIRLDEIVELATVAVAFRNNRVGFAELKAAADKLDELKARYQREGNDG